MRPWTTAAVLAAAIAPFCIALVPAGAMPAAATSPVDAAAAALPVTRVQLFSSGVGYFEHFGVVHGDGSAELRFTTNQINDILKSLVLQDLDGGQISAVTYASNDPLSKTLKSFAIDVTKNPSLAELLNQLRGARVNVDAEGGPLQGVVLGVENHTHVVDGPLRGTIVESMLNLLSDGRIIAKPLSQVRSVALDDPHLQDELNKALAAVAGARDQDKKPITIAFTGSGDHHVRIGYVVQTPVWKTSYRLLLGEHSTGPDSSKASSDNLQGWAIVENQTDNDWSGVQLSLVSGRPMSFVEDLYQPQYIDRPTVQPEQFAGLQPQVYAAGQAGLGYLEDREKDRLESSVAAHGVSDAPVAASRSLAMIDAASSVHSMAATSAAGELFQYTVDHVSLPRRQSSMIPIVTDPIHVLRVSIYNESVLSNHPLNGALVINTTKKHLLAGPVTVLDGGVYAGDAQIDNLPPGDKRLLSYGIDLQTDVDAAHRTVSDHVTSGKIVKGVLILTRKQVRSQDYAIKNKSDHVRTLVIEHPRDTQWSLVDTATPTEVAPQLYRFNVDVAAGKPAKLTVNEQFIQQQSFELLPNGTESLETYRRDGEIPPAVAVALAKVIGLKQALVDTQTLIDGDKSQQTQISTEQDRMRENLKAVQPSSTYYERLMTKLNDQETRLEQIQADQSTLEKKRESQAHDLESYVNGLNVG